MAKSQERVGGDVGRIDRQLGEEKARVEGLQKGLGETRAATEDAARKATEAATLAGQAQSRADEAGTKPPTRPPGPTRPAPPRGRRSRR